MEEEIIVNNCPSPEAVAAWQEFYHSIELHNKHAWHQVGRCVWCGPCDIQLFQGKIPKGHPVFVPTYKVKSRNQSRTMRERWNLQ